MARQKTIVNQLETELEKIKREQERQQAILKNELRGRIADQSALVSVGQDPGTPISRGEFIAAGYTEKEYKNYLEDWKLYPLMNEVSGMPRQEALVRLEQLKPTKAEGAAEAARR